MKLNTRRTLLIGLAFFSICAFWQMYDTIIPLILRDTFHIGDSLSGAIMAADNVLALFLLPLFGKLSDRTNTRLGKRMPFILFGTACAVALTLLLSGADAPGRFGLFIALLGLLLIAMGTYRSPAVALMPDVTPKPLRSKANAIINLMGALGASTRWRRCGCWWAPMPMAAPTTRRVHRRGGADGGVGAAAAVAGG